MYTAWAILHHNYAATVSEYGGPQSQPLSPCQGGYGLHVDFPDPVTIKHGDSGGGDQLGKRKTGAEEGVSQG